MIGTGKGPNPAKSTGFLAQSTGFQAERLPRMTANHHSLTTMHATTPRLASLFALTAALAGCGGGGDKTNTPAPPPTPTAPVGISFVHPTNNVLEPGTSEGLAVNVTVNGSPAPNGTTATFTVTNAIGTLAPVAPTTVAGVARTTLSVVGGLPPTSTFQVTATATRFVHQAGGVRLNTRQPGKQR